MTQNGEPLKKTLIGSVQLSGAHQIRIELAKYPQRWIFKAARCSVNRQGTLIYARKQAAFDIKHLSAFKALVRKALKRAKRDGLLPNGDRGE